MKLHELTLHDRDLCVSFLSVRRHELSSYAFETIFMWRALYAIFWGVYENALYVFFKDALGGFLYVSPSGASSPSLKGIAMAFHHMDAWNRNSEMSRIDNVESCDIDFYRGQGFICQEKGHEYLYARKELAGLRGNRFKHKRAAYNQFHRRGDFTYESFSRDDEKACLDLYDAWRRERAEKYQDPVYQGMLADSRRALEVVLAHYADLHLVGRVVKVKGRLCAFTLGFMLNPHTLCIIYEITDVSVKGISQYIFRSFCREHAECAYVNVMDDSGLENLKRLKLSYRPVRMVRSYTVTRRCRERGS